MRWCLRAAWLAPPDCARGTPRDRSDRPPASAKDGQGKSEPPEGEAKPGKDINAAGFVKDKDSAKP